MMILLVWLCGLALAQPRPTLAECGWLAGTWTAHDDGHLEEHWLEPFGQSKLGSCRIVNQGRTVHKEFLVLEETDDGLILTVGSA